MFYKNIVSYLMLLQKHPLVLVLEMIKDFPARDFMRNVNALIKFKDMCEVTFCFFVLLMKVWNLYWASSYLQI